MTDVVIPIATLAILLQFVSQIRRLISHAILNRTIRKAIEHDPASAPLLIAKLEPRPRWPEGLFGWILLVVGLSLGVAALFGVATELRSTLQLAAVSITLGVGVLLYAWWVERNTPSL